MSTGICVDNTLKIRDNRCVEMVCDMKEIQIRKNDAGQRLDRFVGKAVPLLPESLLPLRQPDSSSAAATAQLRRAFCLCVISVTLPFISLGVV